MEIYSVQLCESHQIGACYLSFTLVCALVMNREHFLLFYYYYYYFDASDRFNREHFSITCCIICSIIIGALSSSTWYTHVELLQILESFVLRINNFGK